MARSQEKAMSMLNRWVDQRRGVDSGFITQGRSARFPGECRSVREGEIARSQILRELGSNISQIQNASLGEARIREINDNINRLLRSKYAWEMQIRTLGGPDYTKIGISVSDSDGVEIPGQGGYRYFGVAKGLPGVRELLQGESMDVTRGRRTRKQLLQDIKPDYYGWRDEEDPELLTEESLAETEALENLQRERLDYEHNDGTGHVVNAEYAPKDIDHHDLEEMILRRRKEMLLAQYITPQRTSSGLGRYQEKTGDVDDEETDGVVRMVD